MTPEERIRMDELVRQIQVENNHAKFIKLVEELNNLIDQKDRRFPPSKQGNP